jgi:trimeric autotransporter adhesin
VKFHLNRFLRRVRIHGGEFDTSARAMYRVSAKGSLISYERAFSTQAETRIVRGSTIERKQMSTKTIYKRISLIAVTALGAGLLSVAPARAAIIADDLNLVTSGSTLVVSAGTGADTAIARVGAQTIALTEVLGLVDADDYDLYVSTATAVGDISDANTVVLNTPTAANVTDGEKSSVSLSAAAYNGIATAAKAVKVNTAAGTTASAVGTITFKTASLSAGTWNVWADASPGGAPTTGSIIVGTITVHNVGAPTTASYSAVGYTQIGSPANVNATVSLKDASSRSTFLVGTEALTHSSTPVTNATAPAVQGLAAINNTVPSTPPSVTAGVFAGYTVAIPGAAGGNVPTKGTVYTIATTITNGATAFGSTSVTYRNVDTTASIAGGSITFTDATTKAVVSTIPTGAGLTSVAADYVITVKDASGALVKGATPVATASTGTVAAAVGQTGDAGTNSSFQFTSPATAGTSTVSFTLATGATSLSTSVAFVTTAFGATEAVATTAVKSVVANDGAGVVMTSTAPAMNAWSAALNVSSISVTIKGLDASKAAKLDLTSGATTGTIDGIAAGTSIYPVANAAGEITFKLGVASAANDNTLVVTVDADGGGSPVTVLTITYKTTAATITTTPATASLSMATPSDTKTITAAITDQFKNAITGGSFKLTNTVVPVGATAATVQTANATAAGTATFTVVLGATLGTYTYTVEALSANAASLATSTINYSVTTTGIAGTLTLTDNDGDALTLTTDDKGTRAVPINATALSVTTTNVSNAAVITVTSATPAGLAFTATATNGIRLFTAAPSGVLAVGKSEVTGTAGSSANLWAVPTKVGAGTITVVAGGLTKVYTLTGALAAANVKAGLVTLTTSTAGQYTVAATDVFGNGVAAADIAVSLAGAGSFGNGFKNLTVTTGADGTNTFSVVSSGETGTVISAALAAGIYTAVTAADMTTLGIVGPGTLGATTGTTTATMAAGVSGATNAAVDAATAAAELAEAAAQDATDAALDATEAATLAGALAQEAVDAVADLSAQVATLISALKKQITTLTNLVIKIQKKVRA